jgi:Flp pilus assembly protein TadD
VRSEGTKYIEAPKPELYDLHADPGELKNNYEPGSTSISKLQSLLPQRKETTAQSLPDPKDKIEEQNLLHQAMLASDDNRPADARAALEKTLDLDPKSATALRQLGELEFNAGDYAKAAGHLKSAREVRPDDATAAYMQGQALQKAGDLSGARDALDASLKLLPGQFEARLLLGQVYLQLKDPKAAEDQGQAALLVKSDSVDAAILVARAQIADGRFNDATETVHLFMNPVSTRIKVFDALAQAYAAAGKEDDARRMKKQADDLRMSQPKTR